MSNKLLSDGHQDEMYIWIPDIKHEWILALLTDIRSIDDLRNDDRIVVSLPQASSSISQEIDHSSPLLKRVVKYGDTILAESEEVHYLTTNRRCRSLCSQLIFSEPAVLQVLRQTYNNIPTETKYFTISESPFVLLVLDPSNSSVTAEKPSQVFQLDTKEGTESDNYLQFFIYDFIASRSSLSVHTELLQFQPPGSHSVHPQPHPENNRTVVIVGNSCSSRAGSLLVTAHRVAEIVMATDENSISATTPHAVMLYRNFKCILEAFTSRKSRYGDGIESLCATAVTVLRPTMPSPIQSESHIAASFSVDVILYGSCDGPQATAALPVDEVRCRHHQK